MEETSINFLHKEDDILNAIDSIIDENIKLVRDVTKIISNPMFERHTK